MAMRVTARGRGGAGWSKMAARGDQRRCPGDGRRKRDRNGTTRCIPSTGDEGIQERTAEHGHAGKVAQNLTMPVSQFTLLAQFKGTKPDFHESMSTIPGKAFYTDFLGEIKAAYRADRIQGALPPNIPHVRMLEPLARGKAE